jgi:hypothetical protein
VTDRERKSDGRKILSQMKKNISIIEINSANEWRRTEKRVPSKEKNANSRR